MIKLLPLVILLITILSCENSKNELNKVSESFTNEIYAIDTSHKNKLSINSILNSNKRILNWEIMGDTIELVTDIELVWNSFGHNISIDTLEKLFNVQFLSSIYKNPENSIKSIIYKVELQNITLKIIEWNNKELEEVSENKMDKFQIVYCYINNSKYQLKNDISIGMHKRRFMELIIGKLQNCSSIEQINVFKLFDPTGEEIEQVYSFTNDTLSAIIIKSPSLRGI